MSFSKTSYRSRRNKGLRGQGDKPKAKFEPGEGGHLVRGPKGFVKVNRRTARQKMRLKAYDDDDDKVGKYLTRKGAKHLKRVRPKDERKTAIGHYSDYEGPLYDPKVSNHERVFRQRIKSGRIKRPQEVADEQSV